MQLIYKHGQEKHFRIIHYPDGQHNVVLDLEYFNCVKEPIEIICSIRNYTELEILRCLASALLSNDFVIDKIRYTYLFGLRSDRCFEAGSCNYVNTIIAPVTNCLKTMSKSNSQILAPHGRANDFLKMQLDWDINLPYELMGMLEIAGDASAKNILHDMINGNLPFFNKTRQKMNGTINSIYLKDVYKEELCATKNPILIVDDLCDGGATFIAEAQYLRDTGIIKPDRKLNLFVIHGLFSKGFDELFKYFDTIYTTNSYQEFPQNPDDPLHIPKDKLHVIDVWGN